MEKYSLPDSFGVRPKYPIDSVDNALRLLSLFRTRDRIRVTDVAETLNVSTGTAHRLLAMLVYRGYVRQDPLARVYMPGAMLLSIGLQAAQRSGLRAAAGPYLDELKALLDETIQLATLEGFHAFYVDARESSKALRVTSRAGTLHHAHCTSVGKALLAESSAEALLELYATEELPQVTSNSIKTRTELILELESTRSRGYALNFGELEDGIGSVAVVIRNDAGKAAAALGVGCPLSRLGEARVHEMALALADAARRLGHDLSG